MPDAPTPDSHWTQVVALFDAASALPAAERRTWLREQCAADDALYEEVRSLLDAAVAEASAAGLAASPNTVEGRRYGTWEAIRLLGSGGMGSVLLAKRTGGGFEQTAAIKLIAPHLVGPYFLERFRTERQILANLNHPNITKLLDGGVSEDGAPYLVMEFVDGLPLNRYADEQKLTIAERLRLFLKICAAVEFAHRNLVVHRDLKPGNILVESATGEPKLLDFGTARMLPQDGGTGATAATTHRLVTPRYASPEALRHAPVTTQADVFSLGVLLYEQVTGVWPFGDPAASPAELVDRISRSEITPPESAVTEEAAVVRRCPTRELRGIARGDLATILRKATEADLDRRYQSVAELASDIQAYLDGRPVTARRPTLAYRMSKFLRRHWAGTVAAALVLGSIAAAGFYANRQAVFARREADRSHETTMFLKNLIETAAFRSHGQPVTMSNAIALAERSVPLADADSRPAILVSLATVQYSHGDVKAAERMAELAVTEARSVRDVAAEAEGLILLSQIYSETSRTAQSATMIPKALALVSGLDGLKRVWRIRFVGELYLGYNALYGLAPNGAEGEKHVLEAIRIARDNGGFLAGELSYAYSTLAYAYVLQKNFEGEGRAIDAGLALYRNSRSAKDSFILRDQRVRLARNRDFAGAERASRERYEVLAGQYGAGSFGALSAHLLWAMDLGRSGNWDAASQELAKCRKTIDGLPVEAKLSQNWLAPNISAFVENRRGNGVGALAFARQSAQAGLAHRWDPARDARMGDSFLEIGTALRLQKKFAEAIVDLERAESIYRLAWGPAHNRTKFASVELARAKAADAGLPGIP